MPYATIRPTPRTAPGRPPEASAKSWDATSVIHLVRAFKLSNPPGQLHNISVGYWVCVVTSFRRIAVTRDRRRM